MRIKWQERALRAAQKAFGTLNLVQRAGGIKMSRAAARKFLFAHNPFCSVDQRGGRQAYNRFVRQGFTEQEKIDENNA